MPSGQLQPTGQRSEEPQMRPVLGQLWFGLSPETSRGS